MQRIFNTLFAILFMSSSLVMAQSNQINFDKKGYYPEGIAYYPTEKVFLVGSMTKGEIGAVDKNGQLSTFLQHDAIVSPVGIKVDSKNNRLLVANSDLGVSAKTAKGTQAKLASLLIFDLTSKKLIANHNLAKQGKGDYHFANDLTMDNQGNIYITDSFSPNIYKVDQAGTISLFANHELFNVPANHFGLNGIVWHPNGYLIVAHYNNGVLLKVPTSDPSKVSTILTSTTFKGADGLQWLENGDLAVVANQSDNIKSNTVYTLKGNTDWTVATIITATPIEDVFPTTATLRKGKLFILHGYLHKMLGNAQPATSSFGIQEIK